MDTWLRQRALRTGAAHCEPPESAASPPHQRFLKAYWQAVAVPRTQPRSARATRCSSADRHNPPVPTCILSVPYHQTLAARLTTPHTPRQKKERERNFQVAENFDCSVLPFFGLPTRHDVDDHEVFACEATVWGPKQNKYSHPARKAMSRYIVDSNLKCKLLPKFAFLFSNEKALPCRWALPPCSWIIQFNWTYGCLQL